MKRQGGAAIVRKVTRASNEAREATAAERANRTAL